MWSGSGEGVRGSSTMGVAEEALVGVGGVLGFPAVDWEEEAAGGMLLLSVGFGPSWLSIHAV